jgi:hypothetical protein
MRQAIRRRRDLALGITEADSTRDGGRFDTPLRFARSNSATAVVDDGAAHRTVVHSRTP